MFLLMIFDLFSCYIIQGCLSIRFRNNNLIFSLMIFIREEFMVLLLWLYIFFWHAFYIKWKGMHTFKIRLLSHQSAEYSLSLPVASEACNSLDPAAAWRNWLYVLYAGRERKAQSLSPSHQYLFYIKDQLGWFNTMIT